MSEEKIVLEIPLPKGDGIYEYNDTLIVRGEEFVQKVASALSSLTRIKILKFVREKPVNIAEIANIISQSKANASTQIRILENVKLLKPWYEPGIKGIRKKAESNIKKVLLILE